MPRKLAISFFVHTIRSDWNNGNAHFLRGLVRALGDGRPAPGSDAGDNSASFQSVGHTVKVFEPAHNWSMENLLTEERGPASLAQFARTYSDLQVMTYTLDRTELRLSLAEQDIVIVHEWNPPELIELILSLREELGFRALFHDTHHRASSSPAQLAALQVPRFDGVIAFGEALRTIYRRDFAMERVWTLHEAADTTVFTPYQAGKENDVVWIGNWGDDERSREIRAFLVEPARALSQKLFSIHGVRYPQDGLDALASSGIHYGGYLPNLEAPATYARSQLTVHIPRQQYSGAMYGIPTIRVFEALACGIPLISAPWADVEQLFSAGDYLLARSSGEMIEMMSYLLAHPAAAQEQAARGRVTVLARHTCLHRALELTQICDEVLAQ